MPEHAGKRGISQKIPEHRNMPEHRGKTNKKTLRFDEKNKVHGYPVFQVLTRAEMFVRNMNNWQRSKTLRTLSQSRTLSAYRPASQKGFIINFRTLPLLVVKQVESKFCRLFCTFGAEFQISFLVSLLLDSTKRVLFLSCKVIKMKK